jgi:hypothetical protein
MWSNVGETHEMEKGVQYARGRNQRPLPIESGLATTPKGRA